MLLQLCVSIDTKRPVSSAYIIFARGKKNLKVNPFYSIHMGILNFITEPFCSCAETLQKGMKRKYIKKKFACCKIIQQ